MNPANDFHTPSSLGIIRVINYQTRRSCLMVTTNLKVVPKLKVDMIKKFTPIDAVVLHKTVEHIFFATHKAV